MRGEADVDLWGTKRAGGVVGAKVEASSEIREAQRNVGRSLWIRYVGPRRDAAWSVRSEVRWGEGGRGRRLLDLAESQSTIYVWESGKSGQSFKECQSDYNVVRCD